MISTFSTEMPGFYKQASDESSCIDFCIFQDSLTVKTTEELTSLCRLYSLFFLYTGIFRILQLSHAAYQGSELHRLCLQHTVTVYICCCRCICIQFCRPALCFARSAVLSAVVTAPSLSTSPNSLASASFSVSVMNCCVYFHSELHHRYHKPPVHLFFPLHLQVLRWLLLHKHRYLPEQLLLFQALLSGPLCCLSLFQRDHCIDQIAVSLCLLPSAVLFLFATTASCCFDYFIQRLCKRIACVISILEVSLQI